ncbi:MAG: PAS-domain containing protein [Roseococcus sp.]|nr:PAS-domain containing protein [Roseococcus sp.]
MDLHGPGGEEALALLDALFAEEGAGLLLVAPDLAVRRAAPGLAVLLGSPAPRPGEALPAWLAGLGGLAKPAALAERLVPFASPEGGTARWELDDGRALRLAVRPLPGGGRLARLRPEPDTAPAPGEARLRAALVQLEAERAEREEDRRRARLVLEATPDCILVIAADGTILESSVRAHEVFGLPEALTRPGATHQDLIRALYRRGEFGFVRGEEAFVAKMRRDVARVGRLQRIMRLATGAWVEMTFETREDLTLLLVLRDITQLKEAQRALELEQARLNLVMENMQDGVMLFDAALRCTIRSGPLLRFFDFPPEFGIGTPLAEMLRHRLARGDHGPPPADEAAMDGAIAARLAQLTAPEGARILERTPNGHWLDIRTQPLPDGGLLAYYRDVTDLKRAEERAEAERRLLAELLDGLDDAVILLGPDDRIVASNRRAGGYLAELAGLLAPGTHIRDLLSGLYRRGDYGEERSEEEIIAARLGALRTPGGARHTRRTREGAWLEFLVSPLSGGRLVLQLRDITALKRQEAETEAERALLAEVVESMEQMVVLLDREARILLGNRRGAELLDLPPALVETGGSLREAMRAMYRRGDFGAERSEEEVVEGRVAAVLSGRPLQITRRTPAGRWLEFAYTPISGGRVIAQGRDVTALKQGEQAALAAKEAAEAAAQAKSAFLAAMSHEIRTPMNGVLGMLEVLERSPLAPEQARQVAVMRESAQSLLRILDEVLDFSKIEAGRMELEALPFSLSALVAGVMETLAPEARRRGLVFFADPVPAGPDWLEGDPTRVRQILFNLAGNALKFTERGFVRLAAAAQAENGAARLTLTVEDSGVGIEEATLPRLFQPFTQADSSTTRRFGGTGLGLSIVRRLAELMGGSVTVESRPGQGSRFTVTLRLGLAAGPAPAAPREALRARAPAPGEAAAVLVVDDHPVNREVLLRQLALLGLGAETAADGAEALARWHATQPGLVLLDLHMPGMDGHALARAIRTAEERLERPRTTLIAVTADARKGEAERCYAAGMDGYLAKPVTLEALSRALGRFLPGLAEGGAAQGGALFDPEALRGLFGHDPARLSALLEGFAAQARRDIAGLAQAPLPARAEAAHRLKGAAQLVGARLLAGEAQALEAAARAGAAEAAEAAQARLLALLEETLAVARPLLAGDQSAGGTKR